MDMDSNRTLPLQPTQLEPVNLEMGPPQVIPDETQEASEPDIEIISSDQLLKSSNQQSPSKSHPPQKKRRIKTHQELDLNYDDHAAYNMKFDHNKKRIRKQSAAGKASAKTLERLLTLSPPAKELHVQSSGSKDHTNDRSQKTRRRIFREGWVLVSDSEPDSALNAQQEISTSIENQSRASLEQAPKEICPPPQAELSSNKLSPSFLELISSPLTSPSGFSADEREKAKAIKKSKTSIGKKPGPKKKSTTKPKAKRGRKGKNNDTEVHLTTATLASNGECSLGDSTSNLLKNPTTPSAHNNSEAAPDVSSKVDMNEPPPIIPSITYQSSGGDLGGEKVVLSQPVSSTDKERSTSGDQLKASDKPQSSSLKAPLPPNHSNHTTPSVAVHNIKKHNKIKQKKNVKSASLAEILACTNPKTKRGLRIGLPREDKHRLHSKINPNPVVQIQVKKKLKVKRGEYDSGEDDDQRSCKKNLSDTDTDNDKQNNSKTVLSKTCLSQDDPQEVDDEDPDRNQKFDLDDEEY